jgi:uncharacterized membrane protein
VTKPDRPPYAPNDTLALRNVETVARIEQAAQAQRTTGERLSDCIARFCGSMVFVWIHIIWYTGWIVYNVLPVTRHFDPFPFPFLTLTVSLEAIFLTTFILISQNRQSQLDEQRNMLDLQINLLAEQENSKMLAMLAAIMERLGLEAHDPELEALVSETRPEALLEEINRLKRDADTSHKAT